MRTPERYQHAMRDLEHRLRAMQFDQVDFANKSVLDLGCNAGQFCIAAGHRGATRIVGLDRDDRVLASAHQAAQEAGLPHIEFKSFDINQDGLAGLIDRVGVEKFDYVFALSILKHVDAQTLFDLISFYCKGTCWLELNPDISRRSVERTQRRVARYLPSYVRVDYAGATTDRRQRHLFAIDLAASPPDHGPRRFAVALNRTKIGLGCEFRNERISLSRVEDRWRGGNQLVSETAIFEVDIGELIPLCHRRQGRGLSSWFILEELQRPLSGNEKWSYLRALLKDHGWDVTQPGCIEVSAKGLRLCNGHHRLALASELGFVSVPCCILFR